MTLPRCESGLANWTIAPRATTAMVSAAPATASAASVSQADEVRPKAVIPTPQTPAAASMTIPGRGDRVANPDAALAATPPTATEVRNSPSVCGFPPNRSSLITGNSAIGIAVTVARMSLATAPRSTGRPATNRSPSPIALIPVPPTLSDRGRLGYLYRFRSREDPVTNANVREAVRFWSLDGPDEDVLQALAERRFDDLPRVAADGESLPSQHAAELGAALDSLRETCDRYWEPDWRRAHRGGGRYPENTLWDAVFGYLELLDAAGEQS